MARHRPRLPLTDPGTFGGLESHFIVEGSSVRFASRASLERCAAAAPYLLSELKRLRRQLAAHEHETT